MRIVIVSGLSGSGKSIALQTLEDLNYYCVDNLPLSLLQPFAQTILAQQNSQLANSAVGIDARNFLAELKHFPEILAELQTLGLNIQVLFLQAADQVLVKRYSETRRKHPLSQDGIALVEAIRQERTLLETVITEANLVIDTSEMNVHQLRNRLRAHLDQDQNTTLTLLFESFGFRNGIPSDADFVFDSRCLPNPHWIPRLRPLSGLDQEVVQFLTAQPDVTRMITEIEQFLQRWLPNFAADDRNYMTIAIGCTGGRHRSVYIATELLNRFADSQYTVMVRHREMA